MDRKKNQAPTAAIAMLLVGAAVGYAVAAGMRSSPALAPADQAALKAEYERGMKEGRDAEMNDINVKFMQKGLSGPLDQDIHDAYGFVKAVDADSLTIQVDEAQFTIFDSGVATKTIRVGAATDIEKMVRQKGAAAPTGKEASGQGKVLKPPSAAPGASLGHPSEQPEEPPLSPVTGAFMPQRSSLADIKAGDYVKVSVRGDLRLRDDGDAVSVTVFDLTDMPSVNPADASTLPFSRAVGQPFVPSPANAPVDVGEKLAPPPSSPPETPPTSPNAGGTVSPPPSHAGGTGGAPLTPPSTP